MNYHWLRWVQHVVTKSFWVFVNTKTIAKKHCHHRLCRDILNHSQGNLVIEINQISWSCPDPIFFKNKFPNPILIQKIASILQDIQSWSCPCSPLVRHKIFTLCVVYVVFNICFFLYTENSSYIFIWAKLHQIWLFLLMRLSLLCTCGECECMYDYLVLAT